MLSESSYSAYELYKYFQNAKIVEIFQISKISQPEFLTRLEIRFSSNSSIWSELQQILSVRIDLSQIYTQIHRQKRNLTPFLADGPDQVVFARQINSPFFSSSSIDPLFYQQKRGRFREKPSAIVRWRPRCDSNTRPSAQEYGVPFRKLFISYLPVLFLRKLCCLEAGQFAQIPLKYAALQRLFKCRISKVLAGTPCDRGLPGAISKCYQHRGRIIL